MKTQNTLENKAKFFAQYWGKGIKDTDLSGMYSINVFSSEFHYLQLKPLSKISDEDVDYLLKLEDFIDGFTSDDFLNFLLGIKKGICNKFQAIDYLRSKGIALQWMDLSVEDLVEYGWIKLKEN